MGWSVVTELTCSGCDDVFETNPNYLERTGVCPDCFEFPDVYHDELPPDDYSVYLVASTSAGMHGAYYRVAAKTVQDARFFARAYAVLEDTTNNTRDSLATIEFDGERVVDNRVGAGVTIVRALELPTAERHDGYTVTKIGTRNGDDYEKQLDYGPATMDKLPDPDMQYKDVLVHTTEEQIDHKLEENVPDGHQCYWTVNGTPQQTRVLQRIWFEVDGRIVAAGEIRSVETGRIWFTPLWEVDLEPPREPPNQGFTYVDEIETDQRTPAGQTP
ncbi:hypothetical protein BB347_17630 (plasmid) [Natronorubrum daqingense]|uniref:Uncharacterized protein n=1 Tax=Natronorubrum daqingense TaxID=588898 RepID=A0A1P8RIT1_9EURY|nr:hypothetical protein BB347_17630 [Natronorubrum daqingense]